MFILNNKFNLFTREKSFGLMRNFILRVDKVLKHLSMLGNGKANDIRCLLFKDYMSPEGERVYDKGRDGRHSPNS